MTSQSRTVINMLAVETNFKYTCKRVREAKLLHQMFKINRFWTSTFKKEFAILIIFSITRSSYEILCGYMWGQFGNYSLPLNMRFVNFCTDVSILNDMAGFGIFYIKKKKVIHRPRKIGGI